MRWGRIIAALLVVVVGLAVGGYGAILWLKRPGLGSQVSAGAWRADLDAGNQAAGMFTRARVALNGLLALNRDETIYFVAAKDDGGQELTGGCRYDVAGMPPAARWWSITLYGEDLFLASNPVNRFSFNQSNVTRDGNGAFHIAVANAQQPGDWLPAPPGKFILVLRLYNPEAALAQNPASLPAPTITRGPCVAIAGGKP